MSHLHAFTLLNFCVSMASGPAACTTPASIQIFAPHCPLRLTRSLTGVSQCDKVGFAWWLLQLLWHKPRAKPEESVSEDPSLSKEERTTVFRDWEAGCMCNACMLNGCSLLSKGQCSSVKQPGQAWHSLLRFWLNVSHEESLGSALMGSVPAAGNYSQCNRISPKLDIPKPLEHKLSRLFRTRGSIHTIILLANGQKIPREREIRCSVVS